MRHLADNLSPATKVAVGLLLAAASLAAIASASPRSASPPSATRPAPKPGAAASTPRRSSRLPAPRIVSHPDSISTTATARFSFSAPGEARLGCRLDRGRFRACGSPVVYRGLAVGAHSFYVRATRRRRHGRSARFSWTVVEPKPFSIIPRLGGLGPLLPGAPPTPLPLVISNPNSVPITVTGLRVSATSGPAGCDGAENLALATPDLSAAGLEVPAGGSVSLPSGAVAAPTIQLLDLPVNQDACENGQFGLTFAGTAGG